MYSAHLTYRQSGNDTHAYHLKLSFPSQFGRATKKALHLGLILILLLAGLTPHAPKAAAAGNNMQTGYYTGDSTSGHAITGLGFKPDLVLLKGDGAVTGNRAVLATSAMPTGNASRVTDSLADITDGSDITSLDADGFTLGASPEANAQGVRYTYLAFSGSNCSSSGTFCVGSYTGTGSAGNSVDTGFQPDLVWVKGSSTTPGVFRSSAMPDNTTELFTTTAQDTTGSYLQPFTSSGFTMGSAAQVNASGGTYWYVAFKSVPGTMAVGSYTGNGTSQSIAGVGFSPSFVLFKNSSSATRQAAGYNLTQSNGNDSSSFSTSSVNLIGGITSLDSDGFSVGSAPAANNSGDTLYWAAFGGGAAASASGSSSMTSGSYTGNGTSQSIAGLGFVPSLVIIGTSGQDIAFRTSMMKGDDTGIFSGGYDFTGGITSLDGDGFTVGSNAKTNTSGSSYYWSAFGNAWNPETHTGSGDLEIGSYIGNGGTGYTIGDLPFSPDLVVTKIETSISGAWSTSGMATGTSQFFGATAQNTTGDDFSSLNTGSFTLGSGTPVNAKGYLYNWFAFKTGGGFHAGLYTGNGTSQSITGVGFQPSLAWTKATTSRAASLTSSSVPSGTSLRFGGQTSATNDITSLDSDGFSVGSGIESNINNVTYWYVAWAAGSSPVVSVAVTNGTVDSDMSPASSFNTTSGGLDNTQTATNDGNVPEDFNIKGQASADWTLASSPGSEQYAHYFCVNGSGSPDPCDASPTWTALSTSYQTLATNLATTGSQRFDLKITTPVSSSANSPQTVSVTVQAVMH